MKTTDQTDNDETEWCFLNVSVVLAWIALFAIIMNRETAAITVAILAHLSFSYFKWDNMDLPRPRSRTDNETTNKSP